MPRLIYLAVLSMVLLSGCGGGSGSSAGKTKPTPTPPEQRTESIVATWFYEYPNACLETLEFNADGSFEVHSAEAYIAGTYEFDNTVDSGERHSLVLNFEQQNQEYDCENSNEYVVGTSVELFADFPDAMRMKWYESQQSTEALFDLERAVRLSLSNLPETVQAGSEVTFNVSADVDFAAPISLLYGPQGMVVSESGEVTWTASVPMISPKSTVHFSFASEQALEPVTAEIQVIHPNFQAPTMRKGIEVAYTSNGIQIGNFIGDTDNEILIFDRLGVLSIVEQQGDAYHSVFSYPYSFSGGDEMKRMSVYDSNNDGIVEAFVAAKNEIFHVADIKLPPLSVFTSQQRIINFAVDNLDADPKPELALLLANESGSKAVVILDDDFQAELLRTSVTTSDTIEMAIANIDDDESLELVLSSGQVYDISSAENQWYNADGFGQTMTTGDINNDGIEEIIASVGWGPLTVWDAQSRTQVVSISNQDNCSVTTANIDDDLAAEIILGDCQWGNIHAYDVTGDSYTEKWQLDMVDHGSQALIAGDVNNDGQDELVWGSGISHTGEDMLVVASMQPTPEVSWYNKNPAQLDSFVAAGWAQLSPEEEGAVYVIPSTDSGYEGQRYAIMNENGKVTLSDETSTNWANSWQGLIGDVNADGYDEMFLLGADYYDGRLDVIELHSGINQWQLTANGYNNGFSTIAVADINDDGRDDALLASREILTIHDISNEKVIDTWAAGSEIRSVSVTTDNQDNKVILLSTYSSIIALNIDDGKLSLRSSRESIDQKSCSQLFAHPESDEFVCVVSDYDNLILAKFSLDMSTTSKVTLQGEVTGAVQKPDSDNVYITMSINDSYWESQETVVAEVSVSTGAIIWQSRPLAGTTRKNSIHLGAADRQGSTPLVIGTNAGMILTH